MRLVESIARGKPRPFSMGFILTNRCNFRCGHCTIPQTPSDEMSAREFMHAIDDLAAHGMMRAGFSGGELFLREDALDIVAHAKSRGLVTTLNTNGWMALDSIDRWERIVDLLIVSLDGPRDRHDQLRGKPGSYHRAIRLLEEARSRGVNTAVVCVIGPWNLDCIEEVLDVAGQVGSWAYFQPAYRDNFRVTAGMNSDISADDLRRIARLLREARGKGRPLGNSDGFLRLLEQGPPFGDCRKCVAGKYFGTVLPDGLVVPCHGLAALEGWHNGRERGFARAFLDMPAIKKGPGCSCSPYMESDLVFHGSPSALLTAAHRMVMPAPTRRT
jgi:MoaA/NifB/PqqE/SkfB family radical SAM enzyme